MQKRKTGQALVSNNPQSINQSIKQSVKLYRKPVAHNNICTTNVWSRGLEIQDLTGENWSQK